MPATAKASTSAAKEANDELGDQHRGEMEAGEGDHQQQQQAQQPQQKKRKRVHYSCSECFRRKHKCDRQIPCQRCIQRRVPHLCKPFEDNDSSEDVLTRVSRLEDLVESLLERETNKDKKDAAGEGSTSPGPRARRDSQDLGEEGSGHRGPDEDEGPPPEGGYVGATGSFYGAVALPSFNPGRIVTKIRGQLYSVDPETVSAPVSASSIYANGIESLRRFMAEGGVEPDALFRLAAELPPREQCNILVDLFFHDIHWVRMPMHEPTFRKAYGAMMEELSRQREAGQQPYIRVEDLRILPLLFIILATGTRSSPQALGLDITGRRFESMKLYHAYSRTLVVSQVVELDTLESIMARLYAHRFLIVHRMAREAWTCLRLGIQSAQALGLHRDGTKLGLDAYETEERRRIFSYLYYSDKTMSLMLGRPQAIQECHFDTLPPSDSDSAQPPSTHKRRRIPGSSVVDNPVPTVFKFIALRHSLSMIIGRITEHFQDLRASKGYSHVVELEKQLQQWRESLPGPYRLASGDDAEGSDRSFDAECPFLIVHRHLLNVEFHYVRIALHRPYLLRNSQQYSLSRTACFESAKRDVGARKEFDRDMQWDYGRARADHMGGMYRLFNTMMILGIALTLDPNGPDSDELRNTLDEFIESHRVRATQDSTTLRELKIIELFRSRADPSTQTQVGPSQTFTRNSAAAATASGDVAPGDPTSSPRTQPWLQSVLNPPLDGGVGVSRVARRQSHERTAGPELADTTVGASPQSADDSAQSLLNQLGFIGSGTAPPNHPRSLYSNADVYEGINADQPVDTPMPTNGNGDATVVPPTRTGSFDINMDGASNLSLADATVRAREPNKSQEGGAQGLDWTYWDDLITAIGNFGPGQAPNAFTS